MWVLEKKLVFSMILMFSLLINPVIGASDSEIINLNGIVYSDGSVKLEYMLQLNPVAARVNITLLGDGFDDLTVIDRNGLLLDHSISGNMVTIDSLGSFSVNVSYFTSSLTSKTGSLWTLNLNTPSNIDIKLPVGATIVGLNPVPDGIGISNNQAFLSMASGEFSVTYVVSVTGIQNEAQNQIEEAQTAINQ